MTRGARDVLRIAVEAKRKYWCMRPRLRTKSFRASIAELVLLGYLEQLEPDAERINVYRTGGWCGSLYAFRHYYTVTDDGERAFSRKKNPATGKTGTA